MGGVRPSIRLAVAVAALSFAACGSDDASDGEQAEEAVQAYYDAFAAGDAGGVCDRLSAESQANVPGGRDCTAFFDAYFSNERNRPAFESVEGADVSVDLSDGEASGSAEFPSGLESDAVGVVEEDGEWKVEESFEGLQGG